MSRPRIALAFSGGLDTSFCAVWLREELGADVITVTVDTGGFSAADLERIAGHARQLGAAAHRTEDGRQDTFDRFVRFVVQGNVLRGGVYPLSVAAERVVQAERVVRAARESGAGGVAHGSTAAGNDQCRFDAVFRCLAPDLALHAPVRSLGWPRQRQAAYLAERGVEVSAESRVYSVNTGLWGTTVGGGETHDPWQEIPDTAFPAAAAPSEDLSREVILGFEQGIPVRLDGERLGGPALVEAVGAIGRSFGVGRGVHIGDTVLGIKGRIGFEAAAPLVLIAAHRELEKLVLTRWQSFWKDHLASFYGQMLHEGLYYDPVMRDIEALISSSQARVTGDARVRFRPGRFEVTGVRSPHSLMDVQGAAYGETTQGWTGEEAAGFARLRALASELAMRAGAAGRPTRVARDDS